MIQPGAEAPNYAPGQFAATAQDPLLKERLRRVEDGAGRGSDHCADLGA